MGSPRSSLFAWRREARALFRDGDDADAAGAATAPQPPRKAGRARSPEPGDEAPSFVPLVIASASPPSPPGSPPPPPSPGTIEITIGDAVVRVSGQVETAAARRRAACRAEGVMITAGAEIQVLVATKPVDFRKQADGLAAIVQQALGADPFCGAIYVFRSKRLDRVKLLWWDGTGICLMTKRLESGQFRWPPIEDGMMRLSAVQLSALLEGLRVVERRAPRGRSSECHAMIHATRQRLTLTRSMLREPPESATTLARLRQDGQRSQTHDNDDASDTLPDDIDALRALIVAERAAHAAVVAERSTLTVERDLLAARNAAEATNADSILAEIRRAHFGRKSERITDDQLALALEELETVARQGRGGGREGRSRR